MGSDRLVTMPLDQMEEHIPLFVISNSNSNQIINPISLNNISNSNNIVTLGSTVTVVHVCPYGGVDAFGNVLDDSSVLVISGVGGIFPSAHHNNS